MKTKMSKMDRLRKFDELSRVKFEKKELADIKKGIYKSRVIKVPRIKYYTGITPVAGEGMTPPPVDENKWLKEAIKYTFIGMIAAFMAVYVANMVASKNTPKPTPQATPTQKQASPSAALKPTEIMHDKINTSGTLQSWTGKVSHYSRAGCLGCSASLTMANGQTLDDNAMTIAFNWLPMNTKVRVTNLDTGKSVIATVTDTGGFNSLNRIADLVPAVALALGTKTDITNVLIEKL